MSEEVITIKVSEYKQLKKDQEFLNALERHGVDNWGGYEDACEETEE